MKPDWSHLGKFRLMDGSQQASPKGAHYGAFFIPFAGSFMLRVIATDGDAGEDLGEVTQWEHASVSALDRVFKKELTPRWDMMCFIKDLFWADSEIVVEFHPAEKNYVNIHEHVLHLWAWKNGTFPVPPTICV